MSKVLVVGSVALDSVETPRGIHKDLLGGSATHFSFSACNFTDVRLVGVVGRDFPAEHVKALQAKGVDTSGLKHEDGLTFRWTGRYRGTMDSAETLSVDLNVFGDFRPEVPEEFRSTPYVLLGNASPDTQRITLDQLDHPRFVMMDTIDLWIKTKRVVLENLLGRVDALCVNYEEARKLAQKHNMASAIRVLLDRGPRVIIIKRAEHGATLATRDMIFHVPAYPTDRVVDPTGAGDSFAGGVLGYLSKHGDDEASLRNSLVYGAVMGSFAVEEFGTHRLQEIESKEIQVRLDALKKMMAL